MVRLLKLLLLLPVGALVLGLAVINRGSIKLVYWPAQFGTEMFVSVPLFVGLFAAMLLGIVLGGCASWLAQSGHRRAERRYRNEAEKLRSEAERLKTMQPTSMQPASLSSLAPALKSL